MADFTIPKGYFVVPFLSAVHLDESIYTGALKFNPWRWMSEENKVSHKQYNDVFTHFTIFIIQLKYKSTHCLMFEKLTKTLKPMFENNAL